MKPQIKEVFNLEDLLEINLGYHHPFKTDGTLSERGVEGYKLLSQIIINLHNIGVIQRPFEVQKMLRRLDDILDEGN